jgi:hypothetical protein
MRKQKLTYNIDTIQDYLDVGISPETVLKIVENTKAKDLKPAYVSSYFLVKRELGLVSS